jgi:hypothetical protein
VQRQLDAVGARRRAEHGDADVECGARALVSCGAHEPAREQRVPGVSSTAPTAPYFRLNVAV